MNDEFLSSIGSDWKGAANPTGPVLRRFRQERRRVVLRAIVVGFSFLLVLIGFAWLLWSALVEGSPLHALATGSFAVSLPVLAAEAMLTASALRIRYEGNVTGVLLQMLDRLSLQLASLRGARIAAIILTGATAGAWILVLVQKTTMQTATILTISWGITAALLWLWQKSRRRAVLEQQQHCRAMIMELTEEVPVVPQPNQADI